MSSKSPSIRSIPSDHGVDWFAQIERVDLPDWIKWLHQQATLGYANKTTPRQAGFTFTPADVELVPEVEDFIAVLLGYEVKVEGEWNGPEL